MLLVGPSGAGKQCAAEMLAPDDVSPRRGRDDAPFVEVNCAALPADLVESELFGHERGRVHRRASATRRGLIEMADGGTLFLDEITELPGPLAGQAPQVPRHDALPARSAAQREIEVELRVVAATNQDIATLVDARRASARTSTTGSRSSRSTSRRWPSAAKTSPTSRRRSSRFFAERVKKRITGITPGALRALQQLRLSRQRPRAPQHHRARDDPRRRARARPSATSPARRGSSTVSAATASSPSSSAPDGVAAAARARRARLRASACSSTSDGHRIAAAQTLGISYPTFLRRLREMGVD